MNANFILLFNYFTNIELIIEPVELSETLNGTSKAEF